MPKESKSSLKPKKRESFLDAASQILAITKMEEVHEGIQTSLRVAYLKRKGILREDFWPYELDVCLQKVLDKSGIEIREGFRFQIPFFLPNSMVSSLTGSGRVNLSNLRLSFIDNTFRE